MEVFRQIFRNFFLGKASLICCYIFKNCSCSFAIFIIVICDLYSLCFRSLICYYCHIYITIKNIIFCFFCIFKMEVFRQIFRNFFLGKASLICCYIFKNCSCSFAIFIIVICDLYSLCFRSLICYYCYTYRAI